MPCNGPESTSAELRTLRMVALGRAGRFLTGTFLTAFLRGTGLGAAFFVAAGFFFATFLETFFVAAGFFFETFLETFLETFFLAAGFFFDTFFLAAGFFLEAFFLATGFFLATFFLETGFFFETFFLATFFFAAGFFLATVFFFDVFFATVFFLLTLGFFPAVFFLATGLRFAAFFREAFDGLRFLLAAFFAAISISFRSEKIAALYMGLGYMEGAKMPFLQVRNSPWKSDSKNTRNSRGRPDFTGTRADSVFLQRQSFYARNCITLPPFTHALGKHH